MMSRDKKHFEALYKEVLQMSPEEADQLILDADTVEEKRFFALIGDYILRKNQKEVIERNLF